MIFQLGKRLATISIGFITVAVINRIFNYVFYPVAIGFLGVISGGAIMTVLAIGLNYSLVLFYNRAKYDWFGFEWLQLQEDRKTDSFVGRAIRTGRWPAFFLLSCEDPFKAFVFVRGRKQIGRKFNVTDWKWFLGANFIGNLIWIIMVSGIIESIKWSFF